jgi:gluconokinase
LDKLLIVSGPAATGKSSIALKLASTFSVPYIEGDDFHPPCNIQKMSAGTPLDFSDRVLWLSDLWEEIRRQQHYVVVTCSALDIRTRSWLRTAAGMDGIGLHFAFLYASEATLVKRAMGRNGHYMKASMVHSQCAIMQVPGESERSDADAISTDIGGQEKVFQLALTTLLSRQELWA